MNEPSIAPMKIRWKRWAWIGFWVALFAWECLRIPWERRFGFMSGWFTAWLVVWGATVILCMRLMRPVRFGDRAACYAFWGGMVAFFIVVIGPMTWVFMQAIYIRTH